MILKNGKRVTGIYYGARRITAVYHGTKLVWQSLQKNMLSLRTSPQAGVAISRNYDGDSHAVLRPARNDTIIE